MHVEWRPVHHRVAGSAMPGGVSAAAVTETGGYVADEYLIGAEGVSVGAPDGCFGHPFAFGCLDEVALHFRQRSRVRRQPRAPATIIISGWPGAGRQGNGSAQDCSPVPNDSTGRQKSKRGRSCRLVG
jgi:hypothetical protein